MNRHINFAVIGVGVRLGSGCSMSIETSSLRQPMPPKLTNEIITAAIDGFEAHKTRIDAQIAELRALLSGHTETAAITPEPVTHKRRKISAAGRKAIAEAQRKRWAESKRTIETSTPAAAPKAKRKLSAAGRAAIIAATKKRWAAIHKTEKPAAKTAPARKKMSPARKAALVANLAKARAARAAKRAAA